MEGGITTWKTYELDSIAYTLHSYQPLQKTSNRPSSIQNLHSQDQYFFQVKGGANSTSPSRTHRRINQRRHSEVQNGTTESRTRPARSFSQIIFNIIKLSSLKSMNKIPFKSAIKHPYKCRRPFPSSSSSPHHLTTPATDTQHYISSSSPMSTMQRQAWTWPLTRLRISSLP